MSFASWLRSLRSRKATPSTHSLEIETYAVDYSAPRDEKDPLDYDDLVALDAEDLADQGIAGAYRELMPALRKHVPEPVAVEEILDPDIGRYAVRFSGRTYLVYGPEISESDANSWGRATEVFFELVNSQLTESAVRFYAFYGGNDLSGMFLSPETAQQACVALQRKSDRPYLPGRPE